MNTQYLIAAGNEMFLLLSQQPGVEQLTRIASIACNALRRLAEDQEFYNDFRELVQRRDADRSAFASIIGDLKHFVYGFQELERRLLIDGGVNAQLAEVLAEMAQALIQAIKYWQPNAADAWQGSPETLRQDVERIRDAVCDLENSLRQGAQEREQLLKQSRYLRRVTFAIGGALMVGLNASALAISLGLSAPGSAVSGAVGGALIGAAVTV